MWPGEMKEAHRSMGGARAAVAAGWSGGGGALGR
jgi:hypothetical protein